MIHVQAQDAFWGVVEDCLVEFHRVARAVAHQRTLDLRQRIEQPPAGMSSEMVYHAEPFDVACDIACMKIDVSQFRPQYDQILKQRGW